MSSILNALFFMMASDLILRWYTDSTNSMHDGTWHTRSYHACDLFYKTLWRPPASGETHPSLVHRTIRKMIRFHSNSQITSSRETILSSTRICRHVSAINERVTSSTSYSTRSQLPFSARLPGRLTIQDHRGHWPELPCRCRQELSASNLYCWCRSSFALQWHSRGSCVNDSTVAVGFEAMEINTSQKTKLLHLFAEFVTFF